MNIKLIDDNIQYAFDAYCKKVIKNHAKDIWKERSVRKKRIIFFSEMKFSEIECLSKRMAELDIVNVFTVMNYEIQIGNSDLAEAINNLDNQLRDILLLYFFVGFKDIEISKMIKSPRSTVQHNRIKALGILRQQLGEDDNA